jgi:SAM-dependent methyltransferase
VDNAENATEYRGRELKNAQRASWDSASPGWEAWQAEFESGAALATARLLELAGVRPGQRVLDVATGQGEPALSAARAVGPTGRVVGVDFSPAMLAAARRRAGALPNLELLEADMEALPHQAGSFDVVLSRFGLMFAADRAAVLRSLARVLVPGGVLAAAVWSTASSHLLSLGPAALSERLGMSAPPPGAPGPFSMADPRQCERELGEAGFIGVSIEEGVVPFRFASVAGYVRFNRDLLPPPILDLVKRRFGSEDSPDAWRLVSRAVEKHVEKDGSVSLPSTALYLRASTVRIFPS